MGNISKVDRFFIVLIAALSIVIVYLISPYSPVIQKTEWVFTDRIIYQIVIPYALLGFAACVFVFYLYIPASAKVRIKAKMAKSGVLVTLCGDDGFEHDSLMTAEMGHGLFSKGDETYVFTPDPKYVDDEENSEPDENKVEKLEKSSDAKKLIDHAIQHRMFTDTGKPHFIGLISKGIAVTPALLKLIQDVNHNTDEKKIDQIDLIEPQILKTYIRRTFSDSMIQTLKFKHERMGELRRPMADAIKKLLPWGLIIAAIIVIYLVLGSGIEVPSLI